MEANIRQNHFSRQNYTRCLADAKTDNPNSVEAGRYGLIAVLNFENYIFWIYLELVIWNLEL